MTAIQQVGLKNGGKSPEAAAKEFYCQGDLRS